MLAGFSLQCEHHSSIANERHYVIEDQGAQVLTQAVRPDLPVSAASKPFLDSEFLEIRIATILVNARNDELAFLLCQEMGGSRLLIVGKSYEKHVAKGGHEAGQLSRGISVLLSW